MTQSIPMYWWYLSSTRSTFCDWVCANSLPGSLRGSLQEPEPFRELDNLNIQGVLLALISGQCWNTWTLDKIRLYMRSFYGACPGEWRFHSQTGRPPSITEFCYSLWKACSWYMMGLCLPLTQVLLTNMMTSLRVFLKPGARLIGGCEAGAG